MRLEYEPPARAELRDAFGYTATDSGPAAVAAFVDDIEATEKLIRELPHAHPKSYAGCRRILLSTFPYQLIYRVEADLIRIYAVAHLKRRPGYWRKRPTST